MAKKRKKYTDIYGSNAVNDNYGTLFESMVTSDKYEQMPLALKHLYTLCRVQAQSEKGKRALYQYCKTENREVRSNFFVFPSKHMEMYGLDRSNTYKLFPKLADAGFIEIIENNKNRKGMNLYAFSDKWKK